MKINFLLLAFVIYILARISIKSERYLRSNSYGKMIQLNQNSIFPNSLDPRNGNFNNDNYLKKNSDNKLSEFDYKKEKKSKLRNKEFGEEKPKEDGFHNKKREDKESKAVESYNSILASEEVKSHKVSIETEKFDQLNKEKKPIVKEKETNLIQVKKDSPAKIKVGEMKNAINKKADSINPSLDGRKNLIVLDRLNYDKTLQEKNDKLFRKNFMVFVLVFFINISIFCLVRYSVECANSSNIEYNRIKDYDNRELLKIVNFKSNLKIEDSY